MTATPPHALEPEPENRSNEQGAPADRSGFSPFPIVGIGASAGGLEAVSELLRNLPPDTGMAFVLIQHLDPKATSRLPALLAKHTTMPVAEAGDEVRVQPDHVYVITPNATLTLSNGVLHVEPRSEARPHLPIDAFLRSLAADSQSSAIGVILSGSGSDGMLGVCEIKAAGGTTFAQDEKTAKLAGMPHSAIASGCIDRALPPHGIADQIARIARHPYLRTVTEQALSGPDLEAQYQRVLAIVRSNTGVDFSHYRDTTIRRRIVRRLMLHTEQDLGSYVRLLESNPSEVEALYRDLLINVTSFFRDSEVFEALKHTAFPEICAKKAPTTPIRVWVAGCSTGQEAYSLAIALTEFMDERPVRHPLQIFATDLSDSLALEKARTGIYPDSIAAEVSPERLRRFFKKEDHVYRVVKSIRDACVFARQNVAADPPFSHVDLITCRNVLIYMSGQLQKRVLPTFHYALNHPGFLLLGSSETVGAFTELFDLRDRANRIYAKKPAASGQYPHFRTDRYSAGTTSSRHPGQIAAAGPDYHREADRILLNRFVPPSVLVNENLDIVQYRGRTTPYLETPPGEPTHNVLKMAREGLFLDLRNALAEAKRSNERVRRRGLLIRSDEREREVDLEVLPVNPEGGAGLCFLVLFHETQATAPQQDDGPPAEPGPNDGPERELGQVRHELAATKEYLQSLVEQQDAANEELRSANEEIMSSNEELQSTNEELETAKEELQSTNEELTTVNEQLQHRNLELSQVNNDLVNLLASTNLPVVMVGGDLRVRRFTAPAKRTMNLLPTDVGRPIGDIKPAVDLPNLDNLIGEVIETVQPLEREVLDRQGRCYSLRIHPYRTGDNRIEGAVIVLVDITDRKRGEQALQEVDRRKDEFMAMFAHELHNSLAPMCNAAEILQLAGESMDASAEAHAVLQRQLGQLVRLVDDLLDVTAIVHRKLTLKREVVPVEPMVRAALDSVQPLIAARRHTLKLTVPRAPVFVDADRMRITQVLTNLLRNAARFTPEGGTIHVTAEADARDVQIVVADSGSGITADLMPRIFDAFVQGPMPGGGGGGGLGIGLTVVRGLVEMHGGSVGVTSAGPGQGSEFTVRLPRVESPAPGASATVPTVDAAAGRSLRILVVDGNDDMTRSLASVLGLWGHEVRTTGEGVDPIHSALEFGPDVALIDLALPGGHGHELARRFRDNERLRRVVLVTQAYWPKDAERERAHAATFVNHVVKPLHLQSLQQLLGSVRPAR